MTQRIGIFGAAFVLLVACSQADEATMGDATGGGGSGGSNTTTGGQGGAGGAGVGTSAGSGMAGGFPGGCDGAGMCGDYSRGCTGCAVQTVCADAYKSCFDDVSCLDFNMCMSGCANNDVPCQDKCASKYPTGYDRFNALIQCVVCQACPMSCSSIGAICTN